MSSSAVDPDHGNGSTLSMATVFGPLHRVYLDFDETITEGQSAALQVQAVIAGIAKGMSTAEEAAAYVQERKTLIGKLTMEYEEDYKKQLMSILAQFPPGEFNMANIDRALDMCAEFDQKWNQIGIENRLFAGVKRDDFLKMAPTTPVKLHALETIRGMQESGAEVVIMSINWSAEWIQRVIGSNSSVASDNGSNVLEGHIKIYSNEMLYEDDISTGEFSMRMASGRDKAALLRKLLQEGQSLKSQSESRSVFIGDSYSDIQPLLMADVGIVMGQSKALLLFAEHFGIQLKPLSDAFVHPPKAVATDQKILYITDSWLEVAEALLGKEKADQCLSTISAEL